MLHQLSWGKSPYINLKTFKRENVTFWAKVSYFLLFGDKCQFFIIFFSFFFYNSLFYIFSWFFAFHVFFTFFLLSFIMFFFIFLHIIFLCFFFVFSFFSFFVCFYLFVFTIYTSFYYNNIVIVIQYKNNIQYHKQ